VLVLNTQSASDEAGSFRSIAAEGKMLYGTAVPDANDTMIGSTRPVIRLTRQTRRITTLSSDG
jgi:hypothetical protein